MEPSTLAEQLLFSTIRIETNVDSQKVGIGTGFLFSYKQEKSKYIFLVTNKHVVKNAKNARFTFTQSKEKKPLIGHAHELTLNGFEEYCFGHPNKEIDVAIMPFVPILELIKKDQEIFYRNIPSTLIPLEDKVKELDALEDVIFIGYPEGIWDSKNKLPVIRKGITATPVQIDYEGKKQFLIDAAVFPGSSGSPVFLYNTGSYSDKRGGLVMSSRYYLLGIVAESFVKTEENLIKIRPIPTNQLISTSTQMLNLGIVFKSQVIIETVESFISEINGKDWKSVCPKNI
ncbi:MAG: serine protease [Candidatus Nitrosotenuis sp.]